ncbi:hypothetical protein ANN_15552 [Periplaneta americana]|uniref:Uncharacterized protein n=1 Tax=Periplaneta americana TaxID=6978 RepID=A0ABQ8SGX7_PERAM|nr:hypothetical protein ANN_15552 [Periplaneta americana]
MRPRIGRRLTDICLTVGENLGKTQPGNQPKRESNPRPNATPNRQASALADRDTPVAVPKSGERKLTTCEMRFMRRTAGYSLLKDRRIEDIPKELKIIIDPVVHYITSLEVNTEKTKYMIISRDQNIVRNGNIKIGDLSFVEVEKFKYLRATVTNINDTREAIKRRINMENACFYSVKKPLPSSLLSKILGPYS